MLFRSYEEVLKFWFGELPDNKIFPMYKADKWFRVDESFDEEIRKSFSKYVELDSSGMLDDWKENPRSRLALIILLDQFTRNIYRDTPQAFAQDAKALSLCLDGIKQGLDARLFIVERWFFYMPLMHSENIEIQQLSLQYFSALAKEAPKEIEFVISDAYDYAIKHYEVIKQFGRFPHRNDILNRPSNPEEIAFLSHVDYPF